MSQNSLELSKQLEKVKIQQYLLEKRREEVWQRSIIQLGHKPTLLKEMKRADIALSLEPFKSTLVSCIKRGDFKSGKIKKAAFEVMSVELVGNCYQVKLQDIAYETIDATFHSDCKEFFAKQIRRGRVLILKDVFYFLFKFLQIAVFSLTSRSVYLILKADCIVSVVK